MAWIRVEMTRLVCHPELVEGSRRCPAGWPLGLSRDGSTALTMTGRGEAGWVNLNSRTHKLPERSPPTNGRIDWPDEHEASWN